MLIFFASENLSRVKQPGFYHAPRTATLSISTNPRVFPKIATESIPLEIETLSTTLESASWIDYRIASSNSIALLEPPAGARLSAPKSTVIGPDPFLDGNRNQRSPFELAESAAKVSQIDATNVSSTRTIDSRNIDVTDLFARTVMAVDRLPSITSNTWPNSVKLTSEIEKLSASARIKSLIDAETWASRVSETYERLKMHTLSDKASVEILTSLHELANEGLTLASATIGTNSELARDVARLSFSIERRFEVWNAVAACVIHGKNRMVSVRNHQVDSARLLECLANVDVAIRKTGDAASWSQYLMLTQLNQLASGTITGRQDQVDLVRQFLGRVTDLRVNAVQRTVLASSEVRKLADQVHPLSIGPVDYRKLVDDIETLESDPVHRCSISLADATQSLRFSENPDQAAVATAINAHYRNANLRLAISEGFANRMIPKQTVIEKPIKQRILGADTRGASQVVTKLRVDFIQDPSQLRIALNLDGDINSNTQSRARGATFYNKSVANVNAVREMTFSQQGLTVNGRPATVESSDSLRNFSTEWDKLPILGDLVRQFAHKEFLQSKPIAKRLTQKLIATQTDQEFDSQLQEKVASAEAQFKKRLLGPLQSLELHPMVMDMQTTDTRLIVRYRLAGNDQLSAYTSRPIAPSDSQLSIQVHQSAFNNMTSQVIDGDRDWTMQELSDRISDLLQQPRRPLPEDAPLDVTARFAETRPITVEFEDGRMWLTLRVASLEQPGRIHLKNFIIRTSYLPTVDGLQAELTRDGVISVDGYKLVMRDRLPLRAIFSKVFSSRSSIPMVSEELLSDPRVAGLAVSQLELRDGWLGMAISEEKSPHVAILKANQESLSR